MIILKSILSDGMPEIGATVVHAIKLSMTQQIAERHTSIKIGVLIKYTNNMHIYLNKVFIVKNVVFLIVQVQMPKNNQNYWLSHLFIESRTIKLQELSGVFDDNIYESKHYLN